MELKRLVNITLTLMLIGAVMVTAAPSLIDYQGYLEDDTGAPITDTLSITFTIYDASTGGNSKWSETQSSVEILGGLFNVTLGSSTAILDTVFTGDTRYLAINLGGSDLSPRTRIVSSAYSHRVETVDGATGGTISGDVTAGKGNFGADNTNAGTYAFVAGEDNKASGNWSTVGGGKNDTASGNYATVAGGDKNEASGDYSIVGGGTVNTASGELSTVSGGASDTASGFASTIGGGGENSAIGIASVVSGGLNNKAQGNWSTVCGGLSDTASGGSSVVGGGSNNTASEFASVVPGGYQNEAAGKYSFAAGRRAKANHDGAFVWADSYDGDLASSALNQFNVRSSGGVRIYTNTALTAGVTLSAGGSTWNSVSDSTLKRNARLVNGTEILSKLMRLPVKQWSYKAQSADFEHVGPMAQDFYSVFGIGEDDKTISSIDPSGIALAAIQEVYRQVLELKKKNNEIELLKGELSKLQEQVNSLAKHIEKNTTGVNNELASVESE